MNIISAIILGILQGLTEFLPISSTAHLTLAGMIMGLINHDRPEDWTAFIAIIQLGTVTAVIVYFFKDVLHMTTSVVRDVRASQPAGQRAWSEQSKLAFLIVLGSVPVGVIGLLFRKPIEGMFTKELATIGTSLIILALFLLLAERTGKRNRIIASITWIDALVIGFAQACALIPGSSRSGTTITAGLFLGLTREAAARFSFLLSIPAVVASGSFELYEARHHLGDLGITPLIVATIVSGIVGYATIGLLLGFLRTHSTKLFIVYRLLLGAVLWVLILSGAF